MLAELTAILAPGQRILDAGCGMGTLARHIVAMQPSVDLTMLDLSPAMLAYTDDLPGEHVEGSVLALPFPDDSFDIVVSSWVIETVPDPIKAVSEYLRVIKPTGYVLYTFCSLPDGWVSRAGTALLRAGVTTFVELRKCCSVESAILPTPTDVIPQSATSEWRHVSTQ